MTRREELLLRSLIRESIKHGQVNELDIGNFFGSKKTADSAVEAAKKILDGHISGKFEKSPEILKKAYANLPADDQKKYAAKIKDSKDKPQSKEPEQKKPNSSAWDDDAEANKMDSASSR